MERKNDVLVKPDAFREIGWVDMKQNKDATPKESSLFHESHKSLRKRESAWPGWVLVIAAAGLAILSLHATDHGRIAGGLLITVALAVGSALFIGCGLAIILRRYRTIK